MTRLPATIAALIAGILLLSGCGSSRAQPGSPPTVWAVTLEVTDAGVRVLSTTPARGNVPDPPAAERAATLLTRETLWIDYVVRTGSPERVAHRGSFLVSMTAIVEPSGDQPGGTLRMRRRVVTVRVPYVPEPASIELARAEPSTTIPVDKWERVPLGSSPLRRTPR